MIPVPSTAGFSSTRPAPNNPMTWCGIVLFVRGTCDQILLRRFDRLTNSLGNFFRFAIAITNVAALVADHDQSAEAQVLAALDHLCDAVDRNNRILQLKLRWVDSLIDQFKLPLTTLKFQARFAGRLRQCLHSAVIDIAAAVEQYRLMPLSMARFATILPTAFAAAILPPFFHVLLASASRVDAAVKRRAPSIVDDLRIDMLVAAKHRQSRTSLVPLRCFRILS